jgi:hypothetical protein
VYIESRAYASNLKQKVVCGSLLVALRTNFWEFFSRGMRPGGEFVELSSDPNAVCEQVGVCVCAEQVSLKGCVCVRT